MNLKSAKVKSVDTGGDRLTVGLDDGRMISLPLDWYPSLKEATAPERACWRRSAAGHGIHWPMLDYDLSVDGLLRGAREARGVIALTRRFRSQRHPVRRRSSRRLPDKAISAPV
ncbi:MAG: DUF2442 domain-containing protein [Opitutaceae bacterium]